MTVNLYALLGVESTAQPDVITTAFRTKAKELHPDKPGGNAEEFAKVSQAYEILNDPEKRKAYDRFGVTNLAVVDEALWKAASDAIRNEWLKLLPLMRQPGRENPVAELHKRVAAQFPAHDNELQALKEERARLLDIRNRFPPRASGAPEHLFIEVLNKQIADLKVREDDVERYKQVAGYIAQILSEYTYRVDVAAAPPPPSNPFKPM